MNDDWHAETQVRLAKSKIYLKLKEKCGSDPSGSHALSLVDDATYYAYHRTKIVLQHMGEFTLHDGEHLFRVLGLMEALLPEDCIDSLTVPELMLMILSAFFHDIGMAPSGEHVANWRRIWDKTPAFVDEEAVEQYTRFKRHCAARPEQLKQIEVLDTEGENATSETLKAYLISEYIRNTHALRAREIIENDWNGKIKYRDVDLTVEFAEICFSHNEDAVFLLNLDNNLLCGPETFACLPFIAIVLRLADILDFDAKRTPSVLFSNLTVKHPVSIKEWNKHRSIDAWVINNREICFQAKCVHPAIEASIHSFCDLIDNELSICNNVLYTLNKEPRIRERKMLIDLPLRVNREKIETKKNINGDPQYLYRKTQFNLSKAQVIDLLMGTKLYGNPEVALRELLQNSIDACLLRKALEKKWDTTYSPEIEVRYFKENSEYVLEVIDNGSGMDQHIVDNYYTRIGSSFYVSSEFYDLKSESNADFTPTSRFGIGILSCFMISDTLIVDTRRVYGPHESSAPLNIIVEGQESIFWIKQGNRKIPGTSTRLILRKKNNPWENMSDEQFIKAVETVIPNPPLKILIKTEHITQLWNENSFQKNIAESLKNYSWDEHENIREIEIKLDERSAGFVGSAIVAILEMRNMPVKTVDMPSKHIDIEGETYHLDKHISIKDNELELKSTSITINDDGEIEESSNTRSLAESKAKLSLHGVEVPASIVTPSWRLQKNQVKLSWPFPMLLVIDICGKRDLDLNSARTQVILSDKWVEFEEELAFSICSGISKDVGFEYWEILRDILLNSAKSECFKNGLKRVGALTRIPIY
ncbi:MAG: metal dependent phosphohydrolase [Firmicutes bacterium]|nr:metal dependent phosphohydrolase [Bacillota bacterium]